MTPCVQRTALGVALIAGAGGMGKTSLAVRAASVYNKDQFDPVIFVSIKASALEDEGPRP